MAKNKSLRKLLLNNYWNILNIKSVSFGTLFYVANVQIVKFFKIF